MFPIDMTDLFHWQVKWKESRCICILTRHLYFKVEDLPEHLIHLSLVGGCYALKLLGDGSVDPLYSGADSIGPFYFLCFS